MKKLLLTVLTVLLLTVFVGAFSDVPEDHWAYDAVQTASQQGLVQGYPDGSFRPSGTLTRAEFLTMCVRLAYGEQTAKEGEMWWQPYYDAAEARNWQLLYLGDADYGDPRMDEGITRMEMSLLLRGANTDADLCGRMPVRKGAFSFTDGQQMKDRVWKGEEVISQKEWAKYLHTEWAVQRGLLSGYPDGSFGPDRTLTRAEAATVLSRFLTQRDIAAQGGLIIAQTDDFVIYNVPTAQQVDIVTLKLPKKTELCRYTAPQVELGVDFSQLKFEDWLSAVGAVNVLNANGKYFWGLSGFFAYEEDGTFRQLTDMPVIDYGFDASDNSFVFISHPKDAPQRLTTGGISYPVGSMVLRLTAAGDLLTLADEEDFKTRTALPDGTPWLHPVRVHYATGGKVQVEGQYNWGMADLRKVIIAVADGTVSLVQMGAGNGYSY